MVAHFSYTFRWEGVHRETPTDTAAGGVPHTRRCAASQRESHAFLLILLNRDSESRVLPMTAKRNEIS